MAPAVSTVALIQAGPERKEDPWDLPELQDTGVKWAGIIDTITNSLQHKRMIQSSAFIFFQKNVSIE